jgi:predicted secreted acid phosphatase
MFKRNLLFIISAFLILTTTLSFAKQPENLSLLKQDLIRYHDSGQYDYDIAKAINKAHNYLQKRIDENKNNQKLAIVIDVDETAISNYSLMLNNDFGATKQILQAQWSDTNLPAIPATLQLYNFAKANKVQLFFVTGTGEQYRKATEQKLRHAGYKNWKQLFMRNVSDPKSSAIEFKSSIRKKIIAKGYDIVLNLGDQYSDLAGGYADYSVKIPNPYYFVP